LMTARAARSMAVVGLVCLLLLAGCASHVETDRTVSLEEPRVENGVIVDANDPAQLEEFVKALEAADLPTPEPTSNTAPAESAGGDPNQHVVSDPNATPAKMSVADALSMTTAKALPPDSTCVIALPKLSRMEINEMNERLSLALGAQSGYAVASGAVADALPSPPDGIIGGNILTRPGDGGTYVLRFGYRMFVSQPPQFWGMGVIVAEDGTLSANPDLAQVEPKIKEIVASLDKMRTDLTVTDLEAKIIQLSYVDAAAALSMLKGFGMTTMGKPEEVPPKIEFAKLPYVVNIEDPKKEYTGLVGSKDTSSKGKLSMAPGGASELTDNAIASPMTQLLVLFHPAHPEQFSEVRRVLDNYVDRPARQIFIEAMVLEISEQGLKELGVDWQLHENPYLSVSGGSTAEAGQASSTFDATLANTSQIHQILSGTFQWDWEVTLRALLRSGKAEILSRPSVLTLNNRQSTIRVGQDIPIASSMEGLTYGNKVSFQFDYLPTGILLNVRPRITESGSDVSMLIDTIVSDRVPGEDLEMKAPDGTILASAPTISTRRVQTYGRIPNNTPLIIGGLVSRELTETRDKVPLLGDIPMVGMLFRSEKTDRLKREVIIVLTPHVLPEDRQIRQALPKDEDHFDSFGNELFRDSYRIRSEDVFDLSFLLTNRRIVIYRNLARQVAEKDFRLGERPPFRAFVRDSVPGESILVSRMIYEVIKRLHVDEQIDPSKIIYFEGQQVGGYNVKFLRDLVMKGKSDRMKDFDGKALAITYQYDRASMEEGRLGSEPIPEIRTVDCPDRAAWSKLLWELNQPLADGRRRHTILIQNESDITRLRRALTLKRVAVLNGGIRQMRLRNFSVGKVLLMPELKKGQIHVVDADTARFYFYTELYYAATLSEIESQLKALDTMLRRPDIHALLDSEIPLSELAEEDR
jgi:general secretion pathway protein D